MKNTSPNRKEPQIKTESKIRSVSKCRADKWTRDLNASLKEKEEEEEEKEEERGKKTMETEIEEEIE